jgi:two-component system OmpR family response regulator
MDHAPTCSEIVNEHPDVLFLDVDLGDANGADVCDRLKNDRIGASIPVVLISAQAPDELRRTAHACGADGYITKPFLPERIVQLARQYAHSPTQS